jgi:hypothetical protein
MWYWAPFGWVPDAVIVLAVPPALGFAVRTVHVDGRNPLWAAASVVMLLSAPRDGRLGGRPLKMSRPQRLVGVCTLGLQPVPEPAPAVAVLQQDPVPRTNEAARQVAPVRGVGGAQALLAERRTQLTASKVRSMNTGRGD